MKTMDNEKKYTEEEMKAIANEEIRKAGLKANKELNLDEMEKVSGGVRGYHTHEEIDAAWDVVEDVWKQYGRDVAALSAVRLGLISNPGGGGSEGTFGKHTLQSARQWMHNELDGKHDSMKTQYGGL